MKETSKLRIVRLTEYLIEQGVGSDPKVQAVVFSKILSGEIEAFHTVHPTSPSVGASTITILRYANSQPREVPVTSHKKTKAELRKAVLGQDPDWGLLDAVTVRVPTVSDEPALDEPDQTAAKPATQKFSRTQQSRAEIILPVIARIGLVPDALEPPEANGGGGDRAKIRAGIPLKAMSKNAFKNAWAYMLDNKIVSYKKSLT